jgi:branched-chain amino acid aminotransferase
MSAVAYVNGRVCAEQDAQISIFDHGFLYGEGVYEVLRTYKGTLFLADRHFRRLRTSASMITLDVGMTDAALEAVIGETMEAFRARAGAPVPGQELYVRLLVTRGLGQMTYEPSASPRPSIVVIVKPLVPPPLAAYREGVAVSLVSVMRNHPRSLDPRIKSNNLLNNVLAMQEALRRGAFFEAVMRNHRGELAECSQSNLFVVKNGVACTPALDAGLLAGITREFVEDIAADAGVRTVDAVLHDEDLLGADEAFLTSTTREIVPIVRVDDHRIGTGLPGPVTLRLLDAYRAGALQAVGRVDGRS